MDNLTWTVGWATPAIDVNRRACLTSSLDNINVVGGRSSVDPYALNTVQILSISTMQWINGPSMLIPRRLLSCVINPTNSSSLFAVGGLNGTIRLSSIERVDLLGFTSHFVGNLTEGASYTTSIVYDERVFILGLFFVIYAMNAWFRSTAINRWILRR